MADIGSLLGAAGIGGAIGKAIVSLELETTKYNAELKGAQAQTAASTNAMASSTSKFSGLASKAYLAVGVAAVAGLAYSVKAAVEANDAQLKLQNTFKNNPALSDSSAEAFTRQADALRDLTGVDDEAIITSQAMLGQFGLTGAEVMKLTPLIVDLSEKMEIDLTTATKAVGKATTGNTGALARYGIMLDTTDTKTSDFTKTVEGLGVAQGFAADSAKEEPWRVLGAQFEEIAEQVGQAVLPFLKTLTGVIKSLLPILKLAADHIGIVTIALGAMLVVFGGAKLVGAISSFGAAFKGAMSTLASANPIILAAVAGLALLSAGMAVNAQDAATNQASIDAWATALANGDKTLAQFNATFAAMHDKLPEFAQDQLDAMQATILHDAALQRINARLTEGSITVGYYTQRARELGLTEGEIKANIDAASDALGDQGDAVDDAGHKVARYGFKSKEAFQDFKQGVEDSVEVGIGQFDKLGDAFDTTPKELQKALDLAITIARREQKTLAAIFADDSLSKAQKTALAALPANQREAWADSNKAGKEEIAKGAVELQRLNERSFKQISQAAKGPAKAGGKEVGGSLMEGAAQGVNDKSGLLSDAVAQAVRDGIAAGRRAAGAASPSKEMRKLGLDMMTGLYQGITSGAQKVLDAATKEIEKLIDKIGSQLDKVKGKAQSFADSIKAGFAGFADIAGLFSTEEGGRTDISAILGEQVAKAQQLADILKALRAQGASQATLAQVAGAGAEFGQFLLQGGPELIGQMNDSLKTISDLANQTGKGLSEHFFGEKIDRLEAKLERQNEILRDIREIERLGHGHAILLNGQVLGEAVRDELVKIGNRNGNALG